MSKTLNFICGLLALFVLILLPFIVSAQVTPSSGASDTTKIDKFNFELNVSSTNMWLLNGVAYGVNEPNLAVNIQYNNPLFYAYAYKANSLVQRVSDGNYGMVGLGHKASFASGTDLDVNVVGMFMQYERFYQNYRSSETQVFASAFITQKLVADKHYINVQPAYVFFPGYEKELRK